MDAGKKPDVLILSGFLGSGKTTVLVQLAEHLRATHGGDYTIAIIENEIGSASVDTGVIQEAGYSVTEMLSGCVCCTLIGQLVPAIEKLVQELHPDLIILEATGLATPESMRNNIEEYAGCRTRVATLADASRWARIRIALRVLIEAQLEVADVIIMNKIDLVDADRLDEIGNEIREMNAQAPIVRISAASAVDSGELDLIVGGDA